MTDPYADLQKLEEDIRKLEILKMDGIMPDDLADTSIAALKEKWAAYHAKLEGEGAIAQGAGAKSVGKDGILIEGNVYLGPEPKNAEQALTIYRRVLANQTNPLPLRGMDLGASDPTLDNKSVGLANVYVDLHTTIRVEDAIRMRREYERSINNWRNSRGRALDVDKEPLTVLEATILNERMVLLGDPGSGKTTFVNFLTYCLSSNGIDARVGWLKHLPNWPQADRDLTPILIILRDFARGLPDPLPEQAEPAHLWEFIQKRLKLQRIDSVVDPLLDLLERGRCLLLLDGLDEVPNQAQRVFVRDAVRVFLKRYPGNRTVITCRVLSYQPPANKRQPDLRLREFPDFEIAPLGNWQISRFVKSWYAELGRLGTISQDEALVMTSHLQKAVERPDLQRLASNPLLLTVMALVHTHLGRLPDARALLYEESMDILLWRWEQVKMGGQEATSAIRKLLLEAGRTDVDLKRVLWELALESHAGSSPDDNDSVADIGELRLQKALAALNHNDLNWAQRIIETIKTRAGLLIERVPEVYTFPHRTFQEYLAGAHLASQNNFAHTAFELAKEGVLWRDVILLAVGRLVYLSGDVDKPLALVGELCLQKVDDNPIAWQNAWLAGDVLQEIGMNRVLDTNLGRDLRIQVQGRLVQILEQEKLTAQQRARAGTTLSVLGDPRFNVDKYLLPSEPMLGFVHIPAGRFLMGSDLKKDPNGYTDELPQHELDIPYDYYLARYPVTVAQFKEFVSESGYNPSSGDSFSRMLNHPVVSVSWHDCLEYCKWLDSKLKVMSSNMVKQVEDNEQLVFWQGLAEDRLYVNLPSEAEWEKASRGLDGRIYPWGNDFDPEKANMKDTGIGLTSTVGCFPSGSSPYHILDMSGNVFEWTRDVWEPYPYKFKVRRKDRRSTADRVWRGGSFLRPPGDLRCAGRSHYPPHRNFDALGFRLVISPNASL